MTKTERKAIAKIKQTLSIDGHLSDEYVYDTVKGSHWFAACLLSVAVDEFKQAVANKFKFFLRWISK